MTAQPTGAEKNNNNNNNNRDPLAGLRLDEYALPPRVQPPSFVPGQSRHMNRPPPIPSAWDEVALRRGVPRETLGAFRRTYRAVYYGPDEPGLKFCRIRDITRGRVMLGPGMRYHVTHNTRIWPRDVRQRDPLEQAWFYIVRQWLLRPPLEELLRQTFQPKWIAPNEFMVTDQWIPLRNAAPVYCGIGGLGTCITMYACTIHCVLNGNVSADVPFLAVTPVDATGSGIPAARQRMGIWWAVPLATCLPLRMAVLSWPSAESSTPDELTVLGEDGFAERLNVNYFLQSDADPALKFARFALMADNPGIATSSMPLKPTSPERQAQMAPYTVTRFIPETEVPPSEKGEEADAEKKEEGEEEGEGVKSPEEAATEAAAPPAAKSVVDEEVDNESIEVNAEPLEPSEEVDSEPTPPPPPPPSAPPVGRVGSRLWDIGELYPI